MNKRSYEKIEKENKFLKWFGVFMILLYLATSFYLSDEIGKQQDENEKMRKEIDHYTHTVDGLYINGWSEERINKYIEYGCVPFVDWVENEAHSNRAE